MKNSPRSTQRNFPTLPMSDAVHVPDFPLLHDPQTDSLEDKPTMGKLPTDTGFLGHKVIEALQAAGVRFLGVIKGDPLFQHVQLPAGWKLIATDHHMHLDLLDQHGRKRAEIFYKEKSTDRQARMCLTTRYWIELDYSNEAVDNIAIAYVRDGQEIIHTVGPIAVFHHPFVLDDGTLCITEKAVRWLNRRFPVWCDPARYWDK